MMLAFVMLTGCKSKDDAAIDKAKQQAAATGQAQQVVSTDKNGNVTTTTVQPPTPGQTAQARMPFAHSSILMVSVMAVTACLLPL